MYDDKLIDKDKDKENGNVIFAIDNPKRDKIIRYLLKNHIASLKDIKELLSVTRPVADEHLRILSEANIIQVKYPPHNDEGMKNMNVLLRKKIDEKGINENNREIIVYYIEIDKFMDILEKLFNSYIPEDNHFNRQREVPKSPILKGYKVMATSIKFMENIPIDGKMDICFPSESAEFAVTDPIYTKGYEKMKDRRITIRVITEITADKLEFLAKLFQNGLVDEIRILKKVNCGIAVSGNQYMAALLDKDPNNRTIDSYFATAIYHTEKEAIEIYQSIFDTLWENAITIFKR